MDYFEQLFKSVDVENAIGSSKAWPKPDDYDSWLECWESKTGRTAKCCCNCDSKEELVGAHVLLSGSDYNSNTKVYLTILCKPCNNSNDTLSVYKKDLIDVSNVCPFKDIAKNYKK